jgi:hypothetical protein
MSATLTVTKNEAIAFPWNDSNGKEAIISVFTACRLTNCKSGNIVKHDHKDYIHFHNMLPVIWNYNPIQYIALMFYLRNIRKATIANTQLQKGKGERMLSYYMALWLLKHHEEAFILNSQILVENLGYFKDCLNMARIAKDRNMTDHQINIILHPMALALMIDESKIVQGHLSGNKIPLELSLAHKWAPRYGKAFSDFIPYLLKLCNITGPKPQERWRKYIRMIAQKKITVENLLSAREFDKIDFSTVPSLAFNLYKNSFANHNETKDRFAKFIKRVRLSAVTEIIPEATHPHEILNHYFAGNSYMGEHQKTEDQWKYFVDYAISENTTNLSFIPMIDVSGSMFNSNTMPVKVALTMGILMSLMNKNVFHRKAITFSHTPITMDIVGDSAIDQINSIVNISYNDGCSVHSTNFVAVLKEFLRYCITNNIPRDIVSNTRIVAFSDMQFDKADNKFNNSEFIGSISPLNVVRELFKEANYDIPKLIFWNISGPFGEVPSSFDDTMVEIVSGFAPSMIKYFLKSGEIDISAIVFNSINEYTPLVSYLPVK